MRPAPAYKGTTPDPLTDGRVRGADGGQRAMSVQTKASSSVGRPPTRAGHKVRVRWDRPRRLSVFR